MALHQRCTKLTIWKFFHVKIHDLSVFIIVYENVITSKMAFMLANAKLFVFNYSHQTIWHILECNNHFSQSNRFQVEKIRLLKELWAPLRVDFNVIACLREQTHTHMYFFIQNICSMCFGYLKYNFTVTMYFYCYNSMLSYITVGTAHVTSKILPADGDIITLWKT